MSRTAAASTAAHVSRWSLQHSLAPGGLGPNCRRHFVSVAAAVAHRKVICQEIEDEAERARQTAERRQRWLEQRASKNRASSDAWRRRRRDADRRFRDSDAYTSPYRKVRIFYGSPRMIGPSRKPTSFESENVRRAAVADRIRAAQTEHSRDGNQALAMDLLELERLLSNLELMGLAPALRPAAAVAAEAALVQSTGSSSEQLVIQLKKQASRRAEPQAWDELRAFLLRTCGAAASFVSFGVFSTTCRRLAALHHAAAATLGHRRLNWWPHYPIVAREPAVWALLLRSNSALLGKSIVVPYHVSDCLFIVKEMARHTVFATDTMRLLCRLSHSHRALLSATAQVQFFECLSACGVGLAENVAPLIISRAQWGDFSHYTADHWIWQLRWLLHIGLLSKRHLETTYCRAVHRLLALGYLATRHKLELAKVYCSLGHNHLTFFKTMEEEVIKQLQLDYFLALRNHRTKSLVDSASMDEEEKEEDFIFDNSTITNSRSIPSGCSSRWSSVTLTPEERTIVQKSRSQYDKLRSYLLAGLLRPPTSPSPAYSENEFAEIIAEWRRRTFSRIGLALLLDRAREAGSSMEHCAVPRLKEFGGGLLGSVREIVCFLVIDGLRRSYNPRPSASYAFRELSIEEVTAVATILPSINTLEASSGSKTATRRRKSTAALDSSIEPHELHEAMFCLLRRFSRLLENNMEIGTLHGKFIRQVCRWFEVPVSRPVTHSPALAVATQVVTLFPLTIPAWFRDVAKAVAYETRLMRRRGAGQGDSRYSRQVFGSVPVGTGHHEPSSDDVERGHAESPSTSTSARVEGKDATVEGTTLPLPSSTAPPDIDSPVSDSEATSLPTAIVPRDTMALTTGRFGDVARSATSWLARSNRVTEEDPVPVSPIDILGRQLYLCLNRAEIEVFAELALGLKRLGYNPENFNSRICSIIKRKLLQIKDAGTVRRLVKVLQALPESNVHLSRALSKQYQFITRFECVHAASNVVRNIGGLTRAIDRSSWHRGRRPTKSRPVIRRVG